MESIAGELHLGDLSFAPHQDPRFHPGKCARVQVGEEYLGVIGEIHPLVRENYRLPDTPVVMGELELDILVEHFSRLYEVEPLPSQPPVLEDLAIVVDERVPASGIADVIRETAGELLADLQLFDVYQGDQVGEGKKSLAYNLVYQHPRKTLTDKEVAAIRERIIKNLDKEFSAYLRR